VATLWACDFFSTKVWTTTGLVEGFVLCFLHAGSRRVHVAGMSWIWPRSLSETTKVRV